MLLSIAKLANKHGIAPLKKYGQNFIFDETLCDKIVNHALIGSQSQVLEIGPGPAGLTRSILKSSPQRLSVIETDLRCIPLLEEIQNIYPILEIRNQDALKVKLLEIVNNSQKIDIISNLPYNIGTKLLLNWIDEIHYVNSMTLMLQKEVVDRIISPVNTKTYGRLSIICQICFDIKKCFDVSPKAFYPQPKIWSSIVKLVPKTLIPKKEILLEVGRITNIAFASRRKMLKSSLKNSSDDIEEILAQLEINPKLRAENLSPSQYLKLAELILQQDKQF